MGENDHTWELPGSIWSRRALIYRTAAKVAGRYGFLQIPGLRGDPRRLA